jgi:hypothetical protein
MRSTLTTSIVAVALLAGSTGPAAARPFPADPAPVPIVRVTQAPVADDGFKWADGALGAGVTAALLLGAAGLASVRRAPTTRAHR